MTTPSHLAAFLGRAELWVGVAALGAFLVLYWTLRGAPPGLASEADDEEGFPADAHRDRTIAGVAVGLVLIVLGAVVAASRGVLWSLPVFALGFGLVLTLIALNDRHRHVSPSLRRTVGLSRALLNSALVAGVLIVANVIAFRYGGREIDFTREDAFSLSSLSRAQAESLDVPVVLHLVHGRSALARRQFDRVWQLLELYRDANPEYVKVERLDRYAELSRTDDLARRAPELAAMQGGGVLIEYGEGEDARFAAISNREMFQAPDAESRGGGPGRYVSAFVGEDQVTSALIRLREGTTSKVGFTIGHGESGSDRTATDGSQLQAWKSRLKTTGCEVVDLNLLEGAVPEDVQLVVVAGPKEPFKPQEAARLQAYADQGKPVLALVGQGPTGLEAFFKSFNIEVGKEVLMDPQLNLDGRLRLAFCLTEPFLNHPVSRGMGPERAVLIANGAPIRLVGAKGSEDENAASVNQRMLPAPILRSGPNSWVETEPDDPKPTFDKAKDQAGPVVVAMGVAERTSATEAGKPDATPPKPRLVVVSSRGAGDDAIQGVEPTNLDLLMNAASWLRGRDDSVGVPPKLHAALTLTADPGLRWRLILVPTVVSMAAVAAIGVLVYYIRQE